MYLLFGRRKLPRRTSPPAGACPATKHWAEHLIESFGLPAAAPALVRMHQNGAAARAALFELMSRANDGSTSAPTFWATTHSARRRPRR